MNKIDLTKTDKHYFTAKVTPDIVALSKAKYISIPGKGDPSAREFSENIEALYSTAYQLKFHSKNNGQDFVVSKLEGLWWFDEALFKTIPLADAPVEVPRIKWQYRLLIRVPDFINQISIDIAKHTALKKKKLTRINKIECFELNEATAVQVLHIGTFETETISLAKLDSFIKDNHLSRNGVHHEIYLSDFRTTAPDRLRTILREPVVIRAQ
jgi:hypothetical protein